MHHHSHRALQGKLHHLKAQEQSCIQASAHTCKRQYSQAVKQLEKPKHVRKPAPRVVVLGGGGGAHQKHLGKQGSVELQSRPVSKKEALNELKHMQKSLFAHDFLQTRSKDRPAVEGQGRPSCPQQNNLMLLKELNHGLLKHRPAPAPAVSRAALHALVDVNARDRRHHAQHKLAKLKAQRANGHVVSDAKIRKLERTVKKLSHQEKINARDRPSNDRLGTAAPAPAAPVPVGHVAARGDGAAAVAQALALHRDSRQAHASLQAARLDHASGKAPLIMVLKAQHSLAAAKQAQLDSGLSAVYDKAARMASYSKCGDL
eukprot:Hpha_TRINITY_DN15613_c1_g5::TRINITY_DN15613_c1_g5_i1::g.100129::m.100129